MRKLMWKEWHEQSWKLAFACIVLGATALIGMRARIFSDETMMMWVSSLGLMTLPILASTGLVPAERNDGTLETLLALPVQPWRILAAKISMGVMLCAAPIAVAAAASVLITGGRELTVAEMLLFYAVCIFTAICLFSWMLALSIRLPSEARAGLLGIGISIFWLLATAGLEYPSVPAIAWAISPFAMVRELYVEESRKNISLSTVLGIQTVIVVGLWWWTAKHIAGSEQRP
jgi:ABC-type transport system involved in multi-copper enzyme maturation permease subunit